MAATTCENFVPIETISSAYIAKLKQASNNGKLVLEAIKLACANKASNFRSSRKLVSRNFRQIADSVLNKSKCAILPLFI